MKKDKTKKNNNKKIKLDNIRNNKKIVIKKNESKLKTDIINGTKKNTKKSIKKKTNKNNILKASKNIKNNLNNISNLNTKIIKNNKSLKSKLNQLNQTKKNLNKTSKLNDIIVLLKKYKANKTKKTKIKPYFIYVIECEGDKLYTGITTDVDRRFKEHKDISENRKGAKYTKLNKPLKVLKYFKVKNRSIATSIEHKIKKLSKLDKVKLCNVGEI